MKQVNRLMAEVNGAQEPSEKENFGLDYIGTFDGGFLRVSRYLKRAFLNEEKRTCMILDAWLKRLGKTRGASVP